MLINEIVELNVTIEEKLTIVAAEKAEYALKYYSPTKENCNAYYELLRAYKAVEAAKPAAAPVSTRIMKLCACGHSVGIGRVMSTSSGTSCPDCYDRMSM